MRIVLQDIRYALRTLRKSPGFVADWGLPMLATPPKKTDAIARAQRSEAATPNPSRRSSSQWPPRLPISRPDGPPVSIRSRHSEANEGKR